MTIPMDGLFTMRAKTERVFSLRKKKRIVMFYLFFLLGVIVLAVFGTLIGYTVFQKIEKQTAAGETKEDREDGRHGGTAVEEDQDLWNLLLVNRDNPIPKEYEIPAFTDLKHGHFVDSRIYPELQVMMDAARAAGLEPLICSSYRGWERQQELYIQKARTYVAEGHSWETALSLAESWVQKPGNSEHQTGLALDIVDISYQQLDEAQAETPVQRWLMEHCWEYGFILRYPKEKEEVTGVNYEPWHYRYVGREAAKEMVESGICLEEYLE